MFKNGTSRRRTASLALALICAIAMLATPAAALANAPDSGFAQLLDNNVHIRNMPSSNGKSLGTLNKGAIVRVLWTEGSWKRVSFGEKLGYIREDMLGPYNQSSAKESAGSTPHTPTGNVLKLGDSGTAVQNMQKLLIRKGYLFAEASGEFGKLTEQAVKDFQRTNSLKVDGIVGSDTMALLKAYIDDDSDSSQNVKGSTSSKLVQGDESEEVANMQKALRNKGYYEGTIDGKFGKATLSALKSFQSVNGLTTDGVAGTKTLSLLYGDGKNKPVQAPSTPSAPAEKTDIAVEEGLVKSKDWFSSDIQSLFPVGEVVTVIDTKTGIAFNIKRMGGTNHADVEPATAGDTEIMRQIRGSWSWDRRPLVVIIGDTLVAASWNGMPHGNTTIKDNGFSGHFCVHFTNSRTHSSNKLDSLHQAAIAEALNFTN